MRVDLTPTAPGIDAARLKRTGAAKDFESLLIAQMLRSVREEGSGWLGTGEDESSSAAFGLGEEQLAKTLAAGGGIGLSKIIEKGLKPASATAAPVAPAFAGVPASGGER